MSDKWTDRLPLLQGDLTTLRELATSDVQTLFTLFSNPAVSAHMAPPPPTPAKFAGFVEWSHQQRARGRGACFGIVPQGMAVAAGLMQVRIEPSGRAEWGFVLSRHFWSTGVFTDSANRLVEFAFATMGVECLVARIASRNQRAQAAVQKLGARFEKELVSVSPPGIQRDPELVWALRQHDWQAHVHDGRVASDDAAQRVRIAVAATESELRQTVLPETVEPYPLFLFDRRRPRE